MFRSMMDDFYMLHVCFDMQLDNIEDVLELETGSDRS